MCHELSDKQGRSVNEELSPINLTKYDVRDLAQKVGGAQLLPENADYYIELTRAAAVISSLPPVESPRKIKRKFWLQWLNSGEAMQSGPEMGGDPHEGLFVAEVPFFGGGYYCIPSSWPDEPLLVELLLEASLCLTDAQDFASEVAAVGQFGLYLSDQALRRAGHTRNTEPSRVDNDKIRWPIKIEHARRLQEAVTFDISEVQAEMVRRNVGLEGRKHLVFTLGCGSADYSSPLANPTISRPIGQLGDELIVIAPTNLLAAIRLAVLRLAEQHNVLPQLVKAMNDCALRSVATYLDCHRWSKVGVRKARSRGESDAYVYQFDTGKLAFIHLLTDDFTSGCSQADQCYWDLKPQLALLETTVKATQEDLPQQVSEVLHVILFQSMGRPYSSRLPEFSADNTTSLYLTLDELRVTSQLTGEPLALWQFAKSKKSRHGAVRVLCGGFLDEYARYFERNSYYTGDNGTPDIIVAIGLGRNVRLEAQQKRDPHIVRMPNDTTYERVFRLQNIPGFPIYTTEPSSASPVKLLIEGLPIPIWVISPIDDVAGRDDGSVSFHLADVIAFWIWQLTPAIVGWCDGRTEYPSEVIIGVSFSHETPEGSDEVHDLGINTAVAANRVRIRFDSTFIEQSRGRDNSAEHKLARILLRDVLACANIDVSPDDLNKAIEEHAPRGLKRRLKSFDQSAAIMIDNSGLPHARRVQTFEMERIRDEVGEIAAKHVQEGESLSREQCHDLHRQIVSVMFNKLEQEIARFEDRNLLTYLIARHESLIAERRRADTIVGSHLSAMGDTKSERQKLQEDFVEIDRASTASRFVIEYVSARPPLGRKEVSTSDYDRILALASEIIESGYLSDGFHLKVVEIEAELAPAGRLRFGTSEYASAVSKFRDDFYNSQADARLTTHRDDSVATESDENDLGELIQCASKAEFGLSLDEISFVMSGIAVGEFAQPNGLGFAKARELVSYIASKSDLSRESIAKLVDDLSTNEREKFLVPPKPYSVDDVYPWRFNRGLAYLRKPLVRRGDNLFWGRRSVIQAATYLECLVETGRVKCPRSNEMKKLKGKIADRRGKLFGLELSREIAKLSRYLSRIAVKRFDKQRMTRDNGEDIGDVDVAVLDITTKTFFPVEAKSLTVAKTPNELKNELDDLFDTKSRESAVNRHLERVEWLNAHIGAVLQEFGIYNEDVSQWTIKPIMVLEGNLLSRYLGASPFPVMPKTEFLRFLAKR